MRILIIIAALFGFINNSNAGILDTVKRYYYRSCR